MDIINKLIAISSTTTMDKSKLDRVFYEALLPLLEQYAERTKGRRLRITDNQYRNEIAELMKELFEGKYTLQSLIETQMRPYLETLGFKVYIWNPSYSVEIGW